MGRALLILGSLIGSALFTFTAFFIGSFNTTIIDIIDRLPLIFSPIRLTYFMLVLVFISLSYFTLQTFKSHITLIQTLLFFINSLLQIVIVYYFVNEMTMYALLGLIMQMVGLFVFYITYPISVEQLKMRLPIAAWYSWTAFFTLITFNYNMVIYEWHGFNLSDSLWAVILLTLGTAISLHLRYHYYDRLAPIIFSVGYVGIIIANGVNELFVSAAALFLIGVMIVGFFFIKKKTSVIQKSDVSV